MGKVTGFLEIERRNHANDEVAARLRHFREFMIPPSDETLSQQGARCMDCGIPYCHQGCPVNNIIPDWNDLVYRGDWHKAAVMLHRTNNFPEITGRVCPAPCEEACTLNLIDAPVTIKDIECAIADRAAAEGWIAAQPPPHRSPYRVAVVGSGPAGLAAAQQLARLGHGVTVFEKSDRIGGLLRYGIPDFKLEKHHIDRRMAQMQQEGVTFKTSHPITSRDQLRQFDAVLLACGSELPRDLPIAGRNLSHIHFAMDYLTQQNKRNAGDTIPSAIDAKNRKVVVIGGGDTGSDCIGTANRQGAASVTQLEIMPRPPEKENKELEWPHWPLKMRSSTSHEEGAMRDWSIMSKEFIGNDTNSVSAIRAARLQWNDGVMREQKNDTIDIDADLVLLAMGFIHTPHDGLVTEASLAVDERGNVAAHDEHGSQPFQTSQPHIFACGDMRRGQSLVVWAIREGRLASDAIHEFLLTRGNKP